METLQALKTIGNVDVQIDSRPWETRVKDPVGNSIHNTVLNSSGSRAEVIALLESLLINAANDDSKAVQQLFTHSACSQPIIQAVASFAAMHNKVSTLRACVTLAASLDDSNTDLALEFAVRSPELLDFLYESDWRQLRTSPLSFIRHAEWSLHTHPAELTWFLAHGAALDNPATLRRAAAAPAAALPASCVSALLDYHSRQSTVRSTAKLLRGTGLLQKAARRGNIALVRVLLAAGAEVDEIIMSSSHETGPAEATALFEAVDWQREEVVRFLLQSGADPNLLVGREGRCLTPLSLAEARGLGPIVAVLRAEVERRRLEERAQASRL